MNDAFFSCGTVFHEAPLQEQNTSLPPSRCGQRKQIHHTRRGTDRSIARLTMFMNTSIGPPGSVKQFPPDPRSVLRRPVPSFCRSWTILPSTRDFTFITEFLCKKRSCKFRHNGTALSPSPHHRRIIPGKPTRYFTCFFAINRRQLSFRTPDRPPIYHLQASGFIPMPLPGNLRARLILL